MHTEYTYYTCIICTSISINNFITSLITFNMLSMVLIFMISLEIFKITIAHYENYPSATMRKPRIDISCTHQVSFMCRLYVATLMCRLFVQLT